MKKICIVGTGSQARYIIENVKYDQIYLIGGMVDLEKSENVGKKINNVKIKCVLKDILKYFSPQEFEVIVAYGSNLKKMEVVKEFISMNYRFASIISSDSYISSYVEIGKGCIINPNVTIMPNTKIGSYVIIHSGCVIEHDNIIEDFVNIAPGVTTAGNVKIGKGSYVYTGSVIIPKINIGSYSIVGANSVVLSDVNDYEVVVGNPAKKIRYNKKFYKKGE